MAASANLVVLIGNLTRNPEVRYTPQGRPVTTLNLAINRVYKDRDTGEQVKNTDFIPVSVWGNQAENCEKYLSKGRGVYVEGRLVQKRWEDSNGEARSRLEVVARNIQFLSSATITTTEPDTDSKTDSNSDAKTDSKTDSNSDAKTDANSDAKTDADSDSKNTDESKKPEAAADENVEDEEIPF